LRAVGDRIRLSLPVPYHEDQDAYAQRRQDLEDYATSLVNLGYVDYRLAEV